MSAPLGGASFDLAVRRENFRAELNAAVNDARASSEQIRQALSGGQAIPAIPAGQQQQALQQIATSTGQASEQVKQLTASSEANIQVVKQVTAAYDAAAASARQLAAAQQGVSASAPASRQGGASTGFFGAEESDTRYQQLLDAQKMREQAGRTPAGGNTGTIAITNDGATLAGTQAEAYGALVVAANQAQAAMRGASSATEAQAATAKGAINEVKAYIAAQRVLNDLVTAFARGNKVEAGANDVEEALTKAQQGLQSVEAGNFDQAFKDIGDAAAHAKIGLAEVNAEIARLAASKGELSEVQKAIAELDSQRATGFGDNDLPVQQANAKLVAALNNASGSGSLNYDDLSLEDDQAAKQAKRLVELNAQAKNLTAVLNDANSAQRALTASTDAGAKAADGDAAAIKRESAAQQKALEESVERQKLSERARDNAINLQTRPGAQARLESIDALQGAGLNARQAQDAVDKLQKTLIDLDKLRAGAKVAEGLGDIDRAADLAEKGLDAFAKGDRIGGIRAQEESVKELREAVQQLGLAANKARGEIVGFMTPEKTATLQPIAQQASRVQGIITQAEGSIRAAHAPELDQEAEAAAALRRTELLAQREAETGQRAARVRSQLYSSAQDLGYAANVGQAGQLTAGVGRLSEVLVSTGVVSSTGAALALTAGVAAIGAAMIGTTIAGLAFNKSMEESKLRLEAAGLSADDAQKALDKLTKESQSRKLGAFDVKELQSAQELLQRLGLDGVLSLQRLADISAATGKPLAETATQVSHLYDTLRAGQPIADTVRALERAGIITASFGAALRNASAAGRSTEEQIAILDDALAKFDGTSEKLGSTTTSSFNRFKLAFGALAGSLTSGLFDFAGQGFAGLADIMSSDKVHQGVELYKQLGIELGKIASLPIAPILNQFTPIATVSKSLSSSASSAYQQPDIIYNNASAEIEAGRNAVNNFARGFDEQSRTAFKTLSDTYESQLTALSGGQLSTAAQQNIAGVINPLLAELATEIQKTGTVSEQTAARVRAALGAEADRVLELAGTYATLRQAKVDADRAANDLNTAKGNLTVTQTFRGSVLGQDQQKIDQLTQTQADHRSHTADVVGELQTDIGTATKKARELNDAYLDAEKPIQAQIKGMETLNAQLAENARAVIQGAQDSLASYQEEIQGRRKDAAKQLEGMQDAIAAIDVRLSSAQKSQTQHQDAFNAAINGSIDLFNQVNTQQDDITRKIIEKWDAEISGHRRARQEAEQAVNKNEVGSLELKLSYDQRIKAARDNGNEAAAQSLTRDRDRVLAQRSQSGEVDRDKAELERRREQGAITDATKTAAQQGATDQAGVNVIATEKTVAETAYTDAQKREKLLQEIEDQEVQRRQKEIAHLQRVESDRARIAAAAIDQKKDELAGIEEERVATAAYYAAKILGIQDQIASIQAQALVQDKADQKKIDDAKAQYLADKVFWDARVAADTQAVIDAQSISDNANILVGYYDGQLTSLIKINKELDDQITKQEKILALLKTQLGLTGAVDPNAGGGAKGGSRDEQTPPGGVETAPRTGEGANGGGGGGTLPLLPGKPGEAPPKYYHTEIDNAGQFWYVPNGLTLEYYGKKSAQGAGADAAHAAGGAFGRGLQGASLQFAGGGIISEHIVGVGLTSGARYQFGEHGIRERITPVVGAADGGGGNTVHGPLISIGTVNASDPADVDAMIQQASDRIFAIGLGATDIARRGGYTRGRNR